MAGEGRICDEFVKKSVEIFATIMAFTFDDWLPTYEELDVPEVRLTAGPLRAGAYHFGKYCDNQCKVGALCMLSRFCIRS